jgi:hypothetical protein
MGKDYIYAVTPLLEDALMDRDLVHRQTAASAVKHMVLRAYPSLFRQFSCVFAVAARASCFFFLLLLPLLFTCLTVPS